MVKKTNIPQALIRYIQMDDSELHNIMEKNPYYTLPKIAFMLKTHHGIDDDNMELYAYDVDAIKEIMALHLEQLDNKVLERKNELERTKTIETTTLANVTDIPSSNLTKNTDIIEPSSAEKTNSINSNSVEKSVNAIDDSQSTFNGEDDLILFDIDDKDTNPIVKTDLIQTNSIQEIDLTDPISTEAINSVINLDEDKTSTLENTIENEEPIHEDIQNIEEKEEADKPKLESENIDILDNSKNENLIKEKIETSKDEEESNQHDNQMDFFSWLNSTQTEKEEKKKSDISQIETDDLEDVVQDPYYQSQIHSKEQKTDLSVEEKAKISIKKSDLVSETLAKLYTDQGETKKAKEMYLKLIDMFPEKSTYFASLIKKINS